MQISARADYAVRACLVLATRLDSPMSAEAVAVNADVPAKFLEAILAELRNGGIVRTQRGPTGGCRLARPPDDITLLAIIEAVEGRLGDVRGLDPGALSYPESAAALPQVWARVQTLLRSTLAATTLAALAHAETATVRVTDR